MIRASQFGFAYDRIGVSTAAWANAIEARDGP